MPGTADRQNGQKRETRLAAACAGASVSLIAGLVIWQIVRNYRDTIEAGRTRSSNLAVLLEEQTRRTVQAVDLTLKALVARLRDFPETPPHEPALTNELRARLVELPYVRALFAVGADGFPTQDTDAGTPRVNLADRDYFKAHAGNADAGLFIGTPLNSRSTQIKSPWFLSLSRRVTLPDGRFHGVVVAALEPKYFAQFYSAIKVGDRGVVALAHQCGTVIARDPEHECGVGLSLANEPLFTAQLSKAGAGTYVATARTDGEKRIYGYRAVPPFPLVDIVGLSKAALLKSWRTHSLSLGMSAAALMSAIVAGTGILLRQRAHRLAVAKRLQDIERIEAAGRMTSTVAHDFNNLLTIIGGNLEIVDQRLPEADRSKQRVSDALKAVDRGGRMVGQLLAFARRDPVVLRDEDLCARVNNISELLRQGAQPCDLDLKLPDEGLCSEVDRSEFERALMNLVVNARDASRHGGNISISIAEAPAADFDRRKWPDLVRRDYVVCGVRDDGEGMTQEVLRRVFEPFFTTKPEGVGTGLGLSQVFGFARRSGGGVYIESRVAVGTTVTMVLPRSRPSAQSVPSVKEGAEPPA